MSLREASGAMRDNIVEALNQASARARFAMDRQQNGEDAAQIEEEEETAPPEWANEMRIKGIVYTIGVEKAQELGWNLAAPTSG